MICSAGALAALVGGYSYLNKDSPSGPLPMSTPKSDRIGALQTPQVALTKDGFTNLTLKNVKKYNHDSSIFEFDVSLVCTIYDTTHSLNSSLVLQFLVWSLQVSSSVRLPMTPLLVTMASQS